jgi:hypothetical protein
LCVTTSNQYNTDSSGNFIDVSAPLGECAACPYSNCAYGMDEFGNSANPAWFRGFNGTSSSAPVVTGLVGLLLSHNPDLTSQDIYDIITSTNINSSVGNRPGTIDFYEALSYMYENYVTCILGDLNGDGILDISDIIIMIDMVLGNQPFDVQCGDMNGDGIMDISDIILLIQTVLLDNNRMQSTPDLYNMSLNDIKNWVNDNRDVLSLKT